MKYAISQNQDTISIIKDEYLSSTKPWFIGFSGGKDSSAIITLVFLALLQIKKPSKKVTILYCDTGVDIPVINDLVKRTLQNIQIESQSLALPIEINIVSPNIENMFFTKVIGKGYPPPTNIFRWCTDRLRIKPVRNHLNLIPGEEKTMLLGIRKGESNERDKTISEYSTESEYFFRQKENSNVKIFAPIINYSTEDVWATLAYNLLPKSIDANELMSLYKKANGECPIIKDPRGTPCGKGRFGCWVCTVIRKDRSITNLVNDGYFKLKPLLDFRNWLIKFRDDIEYRLPNRKNGRVGMGGFTLEARKIILENVLIAQKQSGYCLIDDRQIHFIKECWKPII